MTLCFLNFDLFAMKDKDSNGREKKLPWVWFMIYDGTTITMNSSHEKRRETHDIQIVRKIIKFF